jgi:hypothetical protein
MRPFTTSSADQLPTDEEGSHFVPDDFTKEHVADKNVTQTRREAKALSDRCSV